MVTFITETEKNGTFVAAYKCFFSLHMAQNWLNFALEAQGGA